MIGRELAITLIELNNSECPNIGTIVSRTGNEDLIKHKAKMAIESHFDAEVVSIEIQDDLNFEDVLNSLPLDCTVKLLDNGIDTEHKIEIQQTFIY